MLHKKTLKLVNIELGGLQLEWKFLNYAKKDYLHINVGLDHIGMRLNRTLPEIIRVVVTNLFHQLYITMKYKTVIVGLLLTTVVNNCFQQLYVTMFRTQSND